MGRAKQIPDFINSVRFFTHVNKDGINGCWNWTGSRDLKGYGKFTYCNGGTKKMLYAHRVSFFIHNGPLDLDKLIDHMCMNRACVNPAHLREVDERTSALENSNSFGAKNIRKTHCPKGHTYSKWDKRGHRKCTECYKKMKIEDFI